MNKLTAFAIGIILVAGVISTAKADFVYYNDGSVYELQPGESVYVSSGRVWEFTRFQPLDLRIQALEPLSTLAAEETEEVSEQTTEASEQSTEDCLGFGHGGCAESSDEMSESDLADIIRVMTDKITNSDG